MKGNKDMVMTKGLWRAIEDGNIPTRSWSDVTDEEKTEWMKEFVDFMKYIQFK